MRVVDKRRAPQGEVPLLKDMTCHLRRVRGQLLWVAPHLPASSPTGAQVMCQLNLPTHLDSCQLLVEDSNASLILAT